MQGLRARIAESTRSFGQVFANPDLRRLQLAWAGSLIGNWSYFVALAIYAYDQGGAGAVGVVSVIRMLPAAIASPFLAGLADRYSRKLVMIVTDVIRAALMVAAAVTIWQGWSAYIVYADRRAVDHRRNRVPPGAGGAPAPSGAQSRGADGGERRLEHAGGGRRVRRAGARRHPPRASRTSRRSSPSTPLRSSGRRCSCSRCGRRRGHASRERRPATTATETALGAGFRALFANADLLLLTGLYTAQTLVAGALNVLVVVTALELLDVDSSGVGYLNAALGAGGLVGGFVALVLATRGRLAADFGIGIALFGIPFALIGITSSVPGRAARAGVRRARQLARRHQRADDHAAHRPGRGAGPGARRARGHPARLDRDRRPARAAADPRRRHPLGADR